MRMMILNPKPYVSSRRRERVKDLRRREKWRWRGRFALRLLSILQRRLLYNSPSCDHPQAWHDPLFSFAPFSLSSNLKTHQKSCGFPSLGVVQEVQTKRRCEDWVVMGSLHFSGFRGFMKFEDWLFWHFDVLNYFFCDWVGWKIFRNYMYEMGMERDMVLAAAAAAAASATLSYSQSAHQCGQRV